MQIRKNGTSDTVDELQVSDHRTATLLANMGEPKSVLHNKDSSVQRERVVDVAAPRVQTTFQVNDVRTKDRTKRGYRKLAVVASSAVTHNVQCAPVVARLRRRVCRCFGK